MKRDNIEAGEIWLVRVEDANELMKLQVIKKFKRTIEVKHVTEDGLGGIIAQPSQFYCWSDLEFVEKMQ